MAGRTVEADVRWAVLVYGVLLVLGFVAGHMAATATGAFLLAAVVIGLLLWVANRFQEALPFSGSPWYRILAVTVLLMGILVVVSSAVSPSLPTPPSLNEWLPGYGGVLQALHLLLLAVLLVTGTLLMEVFFRGVAYSLLHDWKGPAVAVGGSTLAFMGVWIVVFAPHLWYGSALAFGTGVALAGSRWLTNSVAPAVVAQGLLALSGAAFLVLMGLDGLMG